MKDLELLENNINTAGNFQASYFNFKNAVKDKRCDKNGIGFNKDRRFSCFSLDVSIDSWTGYYGNSDCCTALVVRDKEIFKKSFLHVLNNNFDLLMKETISHMVENAKQYKEKAVLELQEKLQKIKSL